MLGSLNEIRDDVYGLSPYIHYVPCDNWIEL